MAKLHSQLTGNDLHAPKGFEVENGDVKLILSQSTNILTSSVSIIPNDSSLDLGSVSNPWNEIYVSTGSLKFVDPVGGTVLQTISATDAGINFGSAAITASAIVDESGATIGAPAGTVSSSAQVVLTNTDGFTEFSGSLKGTDDTQNSRISDLESFSSSLDATFATDSELESVSSSLASRTNELESFSSSLDATFATDSELESVSSSFDSTINALTTDDISEGSNQYYTDGRVKTKLDAENVVSSSSQVIYNDISNNPFTNNNGVLSASLSIIPTSAELDLGSAAKPFRDLYVSSGSLYVNGQQVLSTTGTELRVTTDAGESLKLLETGNDTITFETSDGNTILTSTGTGIVEVDAPMQITSGKKISSSDGSDIQFEDGLGVTGSIDVTGNVDGVDIAGFKSSFDTLEGKTLVSSSTQIDGLGFLQVSGDSVVSSSDQVDVTSTTNYDQVVQTTGNQSIGGIKTFTDDNIFNGTQTFNDLVINGTGSFAYLQQVTGSIKLIGDAFISLNNDTPAERYAGIKVFDSGSLSATSSLQFDGESNDWFYEYEDDNDETDYGVVLFGPEYGTKGSPTYLSNNTLPKGDGGHHLNDSNITDDGSLITLGSNTSVTGTLVSTGTTLVSSSVQVDYTGLSNIPSGIVSSSTQIDGLGFLQVSGDSVVSSSAQVNLTSTTGYVSNEHIDHSSVSITAGSGLTGGGDITSTRTLNIGAGDGISVNADDIQVDATVLRTTGDSVVSSSVQVDYTGLSNIPSGIVSSSVQVNADSITNFDSNVKAKMDADNVVSGSVDSFAVSNSANNRVITSVDSSNGNAESNLTFDGSTLTVNGTIVETSAREYKDNITSLGSELPSVMKLNPVTYSWKGKEDTNYGFIADEVGKVYPELLNETKSGIQYSKMVSVLTKAIQELHELVEKQEQRIKELEQ